MRHLIIDSASEACSVALLEAGAVVDYRHEIIGRGHAERLVPLIAELAGGGSRSCDREPDASGIERL